MDDSTAFTREELYKLVWETPVSRIVEEYAISDRGLAKLCARRNIPTPPRGYWARRNAGNVRRRPKLQPSSDTRSIELPLVRDVEGMPPAMDEYESAVAELKQSKARLPVPVRLSAPCILVKEARAALRGANVNEAGIVECPSDCLDLQVSRPQVPRALRIADTLLKAFEERGWPVVIENERTVVHLGDVPIALKITELLESVEVPSKPRLDEHRYSFHYDRIETTQKASGHLSISVEEPDRLWRHNQRRNWRSSDKQPVEGRLHQVLMGMLRLASAVVAARAAQEREAQEKAAREAAHQAALDEQRRLRTELAREKGRVELLLSQTTRWHHSQDVRLFVEHARRRGSVPELGLEGEELATWSAWALQQADRIDPFQESPPSVLDHADDIESMVDHPHGYR